MKRILPALIFSLSFPMLCFAASFDCSKAASTTEKIICGDEAISTLDEQLASSYKQALGASSNKEATKKTQIDWLKQQRACKDVTCLTQVYQARINQLLSSTPSPNVPQADPENKTQSSAVIAKPKFKIAKGQQYEVCRVFNDYLNSPYYNKGDCTIKEYPTDKRLRSPEYKQVDIFQYEDYLTVKDINRTDEENTRRIINTKARMKSGEFTAWTTTVDVKNDGKKEAVVSIRGHLVSGGVITQACAGGGGINRLVNGKIDNKAWDEYTLGSPIFFDGRTFLLGTSGGNYYINEPAASTGKYRNNQHYYGEVSIIEVCDFENVN